MMLVHGKCALCRNEKDLQKSHIIPRFIGKWLKESSATGLLRGVVEPEKRLQDLPTEPMLCQECELIFSKLESYFAVTVFYPFLREKIDKITYNETLVRFIISVSWRTLKTSYDDQIKQDPWIKFYLDEAEEKWRKFLLSELSQVELYEHHMFFLDFIENSRELPEGFQWYTLRSTDATLVSNQHNVFSYTHFPWISFVSTIFPTHLDDWEGTKIYSSGEITKVFRINDAIFGNFMIKRAKLSLKLSLDDPRIQKSIEKNPEKFLLSDSFTVMIEERKRERQKRIEKMPDGIKALIDIIDRSLENSSLDPLQQRWVTLSQNVIADRFSSISQEKALRIESDLDLVIRSSKITMPDPEYYFETEDLIVKFMVNYCGSKIEQQIILDKKMNELIKGRGAQDERFIILFSFNPLDDEFPFETGYYIE